MFTCTLLLGSTKLDVLIMAGKSCSCCAGLCRGGWGGVPLARIWLLAVKSGGSPSVPDIHGRMYICMYESVQIYIYDRNLKPDVVALLEVSIIDSLVREDHKSTQIKRTR